MASVSGDFSSGVTSEEMVMNRATDRMHGAFVHISGGDEDNEYYLEFKCVDGAWRELRHYKADESDEDDDNGRWPVNEYVEIPNGTKIRLRLSGSSGQSLYYQITDVIEGYKA